MINRILDKSKAIAFFLIIVMGLNIFLPATVFALTSGPKQPEMSGFQPAGVSDMVDVFTGDFKYNLPLLDVDGYPVNLNYQSGIGMDDEASWVGLGWNLNVGSLNRQLRGLPDDFNGDQIATEQSIKPEITIGGSGNLKAELAGFKLGSINGGISFGIFNNSYTGIGAEFGANAGFKLGYPLNDSKTMSLGVSGGVGINSNTSSGVNVNPQMNIGLRYKASDHVTYNSGFSAALGYNTRSGYQSLQLGMSFSRDITDCDANTLGSQSFDLGGSEMFFNTQPFYPKPNMEFNNASGSFNFNVGGLKWVLFNSIGGSGYYMARSIKNKVITKPGFGFLYSHRGKMRNDALMDFKRELDNPVIPELPNLSIPVHTPDVFSFSSQNGGGQFRLYRGGTGVFFDDETIESTGRKAAGFDLGLGKYFHGGVTFHNVDATSKSGKWKNQNSFSANADFQNESANPNEDPVFFKQVGEKTLANSDLEDEIIDDKPVAINLNGKTATTTLRNSSVNNNGSVISSQNNINPITRKTKLARRAAIGYLTAKEAATGSINKTITSYTINAATGFNVNNAKQASVIQRVSEYRKAHHVSEFTITNEAGQRMVYGTPVYNIKQEEYLFNVGTDKGDNDNLVAPPLDAAGNIDMIGKGADEFYSKQVQPSYATSYLLDAILSPDYVDVTGNGISDDDLGTWVKFNYSKVAGNYGWRSPYNTNGVKANVNDGKLADKDDNKGAITYGEKELWYLHSIESKTKIAYFILGNREDGLGVSSWKGELNSTVKQRRLEQIRLYSKSDNQKPIKSIVFNYAAPLNELCQGVPNRAGAGGKLTLGSVRFVFGRNEVANANDKDQEYKFNYSQNDPEKNSSYKYVSNDRWGTYKPNPSGNNSVLKNDEFPYAEQDKQKADKQASQWLLNSIQLPTGGTIQVEYEADDYAYVQNKRAMVMMKPERIITTTNKAQGTNTDDILPGTNEVAGIQIKLNQDIPNRISTSDQLKQWLLNGDEYIYGKLFVNITNNPGPFNENIDDDRFDYVSCYAKVTTIEKVSGTSNKVNIFWELITDEGRRNITANPFAIAAWQKMRMEYPQFAYPGYENRVKQGEDPAKVLRASLSALINSVKNLRELRESFYETAKRKGFCQHVRLSKSFFRVAETTGFKKGGGVRVKKIRMQNNWEEMSGVVDNASYGMAYDYTTKDENGDPISSGVAAYEPSIGNDENPLRQPVPYLQSIKGALNTIFYLEQPFGESYFPSPSVGYSKVTVKNLDENGNSDPNNQMGWTVSEFYTAKEFPTIVKTTPRQDYSNGPSGRSNLFGGFMIHELVLSQGYAVYVNDMHGKPKADAVYDKAGSLISEATYIYHSSKEDDNTFMLTNNVRVMNRNGQVEQKILGREIEFYADMRESEYASYGQNINVGADVFPFFIPPVMVLPHWPSRNNDEYKLFRSASTIKVVQQFGLIKKVIKTQNGSTVEAENMVYDGETGEVLVSRTHNEHKQDVYSVAIPAYWIPEYKSMTGAYQTLGSYLQGFTTDANGVITYAYSSFLQAGDELLDLSDATGRKLWVIENTVSGQTQPPATKRLVDKDGALVKNFSGQLKIVRSGFRNLFSMAGMSVTSLNNPVQNNQLAFTNSELNQLLVLDSKATIYSENWDGAGNSGCTTCPQGYTYDPVRNICIDYSSFEQKTVCPTLQLCYKNRNTQYLINGSKLYSEGYSTDGTGGYSIIGFDPGTAFFRNPNASLTQGMGNNYAVWNCNGNIPEGDWIGYNISRDWQPLNNEENIIFFFIAATCTVKLKIDGKLIVSRELNTPENYTYGHIYPVRLSTGMHTFEVLAKANTNSGVLPSFSIVGLQRQNNAFNVGTPPIVFFTPEAGFCDENNTNCVPLNALVGNLIYQSQTCNTCPPGKELLYIPEEEISGCVEITEPINLSKFNPYTKGFKGNWRPVQSQVFQTNRSYGNKAAPAQQGVNIAKDGHYTNFTPYWSYTSAGLVKSTVNTDKWVAANTMTLYDRYGQELENRDALGRYSAAAFSFQGTTASLVASNAMHREVFYESFEDKKLRLAAINSESCAQKPFRFESYLNNADTTESHSGRYAIQLNQPITITANMYNASVFHNPLTSLFSHHYITSNAQGEYEYFPFSTGKYNNGFEPMPNKKYVLSCWVKDGSISNNNKPAISFDNTAIWESGSSGLRVKARVEGWKLVEGVFQTGSGSKFTLIISGTGNWVDDIRIHPYDAQMKSFAYDERTLRLMAEMDENNFATFYEYDQEGILNRVKKETEKGIMTIKETRSTYKKRQ